MQLEKLKVKSIRKLSSTKVRDLTVQDVQHYITDNGAINHNTGPEYAASIILFLTKAQLKERVKKDGKTSKEQTGIIVTAKPNKNRFSKPNKIKFHIHFSKGMNPYVGLEHYIDWDLCGVAKGKILNEKEYTSLKAPDAEKCQEFKFKFKNEKGEEVVEARYFLPNDGTTLAVQHLGEHIPLNQLFTSKVFTDEVIDKIDEHIKPLFNYGIDENLPDEDLFLDDLEEEVDDE